MGVFNYLNFENGLFFSGRNIIANKNNNIFYIQMKLRENNMKYLFSTFSFKLFL